jgi:tripartite-type tricarboxylate transporter receptor subunit TctC
VKKRFADSGYETAGMSSEEFLARIKREAERYRLVIQAAAVKPE